MPKDHYVAQTYLRRFSIDGQSGVVNVVRKNNLQRLEAIPIKTICFENDWSNNEYLSGNPREVENFLKIYEPKWTGCVQKIEDNTYDYTTKYLMSGYLAYLRAGTPTAVRLGTAGLSDIVKNLYDKIEEKELSNPDSKYRETIAQIRKHGGTKVKVNSNYPKALGINSLKVVQKKFATSSWIVFRNNTSIPLLTSDNPVCLQYTDVGLADIYCSLTPKLAIVIHPLRENEEKRNDFFASFKPEGVEKMNRLVVQSAEDKVIFNDSSNVEALVKEYQYWRVELKEYNIPTEEGNLIIHQQRAVKYN